MKLRIEELRKAIPDKDGEYDVIVAGGGPAGLGAAYAAAADGAKTLLLEAKSFFGGIAATGLWMPMNRMLRKWESRHGVHEKFIAKLDALGKNEAYVPGTENRYAKDGLAVHPDYLRLAAFEFLEEAGCSYRLYSMVTGIIREGNVVKGVEVTGKDGMHRYTGKVVIDATGDGDVAFLAGAPMIKGRESDGMMMPPALGFALSNVDSEKILTLVNERRDEFKKMEAEAKRDGYITAKWCFFDRTTVPGTVSVSNGGFSNAWEEGWNLDGTSAQDLTIAERMGIKTAVDFVRWAREKKVPGLENCFLMRTGAEVGIRETRRITGEYIQTEDDVLNGSDFPDTVAVRYAEHVDSQGMTGEMVVAGWNNVPYRCMLPRNVEGLLVAGKCSSFTQAALCAGRAMGNMMALGQAAGVAASAAVSRGVAPRSVDAAIIREKLSTMGVEFPKA